MVLPDSIRHIWRCKWDWTAGVIARPYVCAGLVFFMVFLSVLCVWRMLVWCSWELPSINSIWFSSSVCFVYIDSVQPLFCYWSVPCCCCAEGLVASSLGWNLSFHCLCPRVMVSPPAAWCSHPEAKLLMALPDSIRHIWRYKWDWTAGVIARPYVCAGLVFFMVFLSVLCVWRMLVWCSWELPSINSIWFSSSVCFVYIDSVQPLFCYWSVPCCCCAEGLVASSLGWNLSFHCLCPRVMISPPAAWCSHPEAKPFDGAAKQHPTHLTM